jgi:hypothetical protein
MTPFQRGFANELIKVALVRRDGASAWNAIVKLGEIPGLIRTPTTAIGNERAPQPANYNRDPGGQVLGAIGTQRMESPAAAPKPGWRPDPGYRPSSAGDPTPAAPKAVGGKKAKGPDRGPAWEMTGDRIKREASEKAYNANLPKTPARFVAHGTPGQFKLKPGQTPTAPAKGYREHEADYQKKQQAAAAVTQKEMRDMSRKRSGEI